MTLIRKIFLASVLPFTAATGVLAQDLPPSVIQCSAIQENSARLACFDREIARLKTPVPEPTKDVASTQVAPPQVTPPPPVVAQAPPQNTKAKEDEFGVSGELARKRKEAEKGTHASLTELHAAVVKVTTKPYGELVFELDNGQIWEQPEKKYALIIKAGESIRITQGAMGSYFLVADSGATTRVRRVR